MNKLKVTPHPQQEFVEYKIEQNKVATFIDFKPPPHGPPRLEKMKIYVGL
jgi:hypothetical protein